MIRRMSTFQTTCGLVETMQNELPSSLEVQSALEVLVGQLQVNPGMVKMEEKMMS